VLCPQPSALFLAVLTVLCCADVICRLPHLSTVSIKLEEGGSECDLDPVLAQLHTHATGLHSLSLELSTRWEQNPVAWSSLGKLVGLSKLQIAFDDTVRPEEAVDMQE
jgi:hypothetical protein